MTVAQRFCSPDDIMSPLGVAPLRAAILLAPRLRGGLEGKTIGLLDNSKHNASEILEEIEALLRADGVDAIVAVRKTSAATPAGDLLQELADNCDAVVNALGDCGSCTSWCVHDSVDLETLQVPVATLLTSEFASLGLAEGRALGMSDLPVVVLPHPMGSLPAAKVRGHARRIYDDIISVLTRGECDHRTLYGVADATSAAMESKPVPEACAIPGEGGIGDADCGCG